MFVLSVEGSALGHPLSSRPLTLGRGAGSDVMLSDDTVSGRHAAVWTDGEVVWVHDLLSRNGSFVNEQRVTGLARAVVGDTLRFGEARFQLAQTDATPDDPELNLVLEDLETGVRTALPSDRMRLGDLPGVDLRIPGAPEVVIGTDGRENLWMGVDGEAQPLRVGTPFSVGGRLLVLRLDSAASPVTREMHTTRYPYRLEATLDGGPGPRAVLTDLRTGHSHTVGVENRATLLWVLARQRQLDREAGKSEQDQGWYPEGAILQDVWGRGGGGTAANLRVLLCRLRRDLKDAGFDPWFLEHRAAHLRVRVDEARLEGGAG